MKNLFLILMTVFITTLFTGCEKAPSTKHTHTRVDGVPIYKYESDDSDDLLYVMYAGRNNTCPCYTYSSSTPVTDFSSVRFAQTPTLANVTSVSPGASSVGSAPSRGGIDLSKPSVAGNSNQLGKEQQEEVEQEATEAEAEAEVDNEAETDVDSEASDGGDSGADASSDAGSSDSGGDAGGGDGGGGGE